MQAMHLKFCPRCCINCLMQRCHCFGRSSILPVHPAGLTDNSGNTAVTRQVKLKSLKLRLTPPCKIVLVSETGGIRTEPGATPFCCSFFWVLQHRLQVALSIQCKLQIDSEFSPD